MSEVSPRTFGRVGFLVFKELRGKWGSELVTVYMRRLELLPVLNNESLLLFEIKKKI